MGVKKLLSDEQEKHAVWLAISGEDPRPYLAECGSKNPQQSWNVIRSNLKACDPDTFAKLPRVIGHKKRPNEVTFNGKKYECAEKPPATAAEAMQGMKDAADEFFGKCEEMGLRLDKEPEPTRFNAIVNPLPVCGVRSRVLPGKKFMIDSDSGEMYLDNDGAWTKLSAGEWKTLIREILTALEQLEVEK